MSPRVRLGVWALAAAAAVAAPLWLHTGVPRAAFAAACTGAAALTAVLLLMASTPPDAIRLKPLASGLSIGLGALAIALLAGIPPVYAAALTLAGLLTPVAARGTLLRPPGPHSPWTYTLVVWHPALWLIPTTSRHEGLDSSALLWFGPIFACWAVSASIGSAQRGRVRRREAWFLLLGWPASIAMGLGLAWRFGG